MRATSSITARLALALAFALCVTSCGIYSFTGTSIQPDVKTVQVDYFEYKALKVNPLLANKMTEELKEKYRRFTRLEQVDENGDLEVTGAITGYMVTTSSVTSDEKAAQNRLTVTVKLQFSNRKYPEDDFDKSFSAYADFDATQLLDSVQDALCDEIVKKLVEDIFNATVAQW